MGTLVIFGVWLLIIHVVNVTEIFTDILKHYFLQTNVVKFVKCMLYRIYLKHKEIFFDNMFAIHSYAIGDEFYSD